jgi:hypothetical protein
MEKKEVKTYKPKKINIIKLEAYLKQIEDNGTTKHSNWSSKSR